VDGKGVLAPGPSLADLMKDERRCQPSTFALTALRTANHTRFRFSRPRSDTVDGEVLTVLDLRETARPTLVSGLRGRDAPLNGTVWLDPREVVCAGRR
jgi:hypothetical protein